MNVAELIQALNEMPQDMPVHFWANGERQTIIEVRDVGDCVDLNIIENGTGLRKKTWILGSATQV